MRYRCDPLQETLFPNSGREEMKRLEGINILNDHIKWGEILGSEETFTVIFNFSKMILLVFH